MIVLVNVFIWKIPAKDEGRMKRITVAGFMIGLAYILPGCASMEERSGPMSLGVDVVTGADGKVCARDRAEWFYDTHTEVYTRLKRCAATEAEARALLAKDMRMSQITQGAPVMPYQPPKR
jgi:hypothetical protein